MAEVAATWTTQPVTERTFDDVADVINPRRRSTHCWCLSHRLRAREIDELGDGSREAAARALAAGGTWGVVTYRDDVPIGWCHVAPRTEIPRLVASRLIRPLDDLPVWSIICVVVRSGYRRQGVTRHLVEGAVTYAASRGAPAVEATRSTRTVGWTPRWPSSAPVRCSRRAASRPSD